MPKFRFDKLIRDKIPSKIEHQGGDVEARVLSGREYGVQLIAKLGEELLELSAAPTGSRLGEISDLQEALDCLIEHEGHSKTEVALAQAHKRDESGSFSNGSFVETIELTEDSLWINYFRSRPDRYPEITSQDSHSSAS